VKVVLYKAPSYQHFERLQGSGTATDVIRSESGYARRNLALVSFEGDSIDGLAVLSRGRVVATATHVVRLSSFSEITAVDLDSLISEVPARMRRHVVPGLLSPKTAQAVLDALQRLSPDSGDVLKRLTALIEPQSATSLPRRAQEVLALEKDAIGLALGIAGLDRRPLEAWTPARRVAPFLEGLLEYQVGEDAAISHDSRIFGGWEHLGEGATGVVEFSDGRQRLTVVNVNRRPVERALGLDLVYYHHDYASFVLVQYKLMRDEASPGGGESRLFYRPSADGNLTDELSRMRKIVSTPLSDGVPGTYRLHAGACYIKLCRPTTFAATSTELVKGLYIPLDYWDVLNASRDVVGPRGGIRLGYETVRRYLNNSLFIALVERAWVGSRGVTTSDIINVVRKGADAGRSVTLAVGSRAQAD
jgi:hypothetical protein